MHLKNAYCYPKLGRQGIGNCLLTWARALVAAKTNGLGILAPTWSRLRLGPVLRFEPVKRFYFREFTNSGYITGLKKSLILRRYQHIEENRIKSFDSQIGNERNLPAVYIFEGLGTYFTPLIQHKNLIHTELRAVIHPRILERSAMHGNPFISVHVRRGDLTRQGLDLSTVLQYTSTRWFVNAILKLRQNSQWKTMPIKIFSDGSVKELSELLALPGCELVTTGSAIGDILAMSQSKLLLASGYSTFSMWASFLGRIHTLYAPGKLQQKLFEENSGLVEEEWNIDQPLPLGLSCINSRSSYVS